MKESIQQLYSPNSWTFLLRSVSDFQLIFSFVARCIADGTEREKGRSCGWNLFISSIYCLVLLPSITGLLCAAVCIHKYTLVYPTAEIITIGYWLLWTFRIKSWDGYKTLVIVVLILILYQPSCRVLRTMNFSLTACWQSLNLRQSISLSLLCL